MKTLIVYSSLTGNTKMVADAIFEAMPDGGEIYPVNKAPAPEGYDLVAVGFWVDKGEPDKAASEYMEKINGGRIALFGTLGANPESDHAQKSMQRAKDKVTGAEIVGTFMCQGKISPELIERMNAMTAKLGKNHPHADTPERRARHEKASTHPDAQDLVNAKEAFKSILEKIGAN